ncbi:haloacid dehalogenase type II [Flavobacteriaceae bacterium F08102]|nr:haloacid dehalogenase type II [Flavobacteriaceae bacterium F08102]
MKNNRRDFIKKTGVLSLASTVIPTLGFAASHTQSNRKSAKSIAPKILFFDVNETLLDLTLMKKSVGKALNNREDLLPLWFTTMLQYSLVNTVSNQYQDFGLIGAAALRMVASNNGITLSETEAKEAIVGPILSLPAHPEVKEALSQLKKAGYTLVSFTNSSNKGVETQFNNARLTEYFDTRLSVEDIGKFKPHVDTYAWAARKMGVQANECLLVAAHGWDIAGALWGNWRAAFISRPGAQLYPFAPEPEIIGSTLTPITHELIRLKQ